MLCSALGCQGKPDTVLFTGAVVVMQEFHTLPNASQKAREQQHPQM